MYTDTPICNNHSFIPGINDAAFFDWKQKGIVNINDLYIEGSFATFRQLQTAYIFLPQAFSDIYKLETLFVKM